MTFCAFIANFLFIPLIVQLFLTHFFLFHKYLSIKNFFTKGFCHSVTDLMKLLCLVSTKQSTNNVLVQDFVISQL